MKLHVIVHIVTCSVCDDGDDNGLVISFLGWWLVANSRGEHGFAPATFLEPTDAGHHSEEEEWRDVEDDDRKQHFH